MTQAPPPPSSPPASRRTLWLGVILAALFVIAALAAFTLALRKSPTGAKAPADQAITVTIRGNQCDPNDITLPAGRTTFTIRNESERVLEWEILDGVMVVEERENIAPGFSTNMTVKLRPGTFEITCGLLSNPRGKLTVTPSASSDAEAAKPTVQHFVGPLAEYQVYTLLQLQSLQEALTPLADAIKADNREAAKAALLNAYVLYQSVAPAVGSFADLDTRIGGRAAYLQGRENDPAFAGFFKLGHDLWGDAAVASLQPLVDGLGKDIAALIERVGTAALRPEIMAPSTARALRRLHESLSTSEQAYEAALDSAGLDGAMTGSRKVFEVIEPLMQASAPEVHDALQADYSGSQEALSHIDQWLKGSGPAAFAGTPLDDAAVRQQWLALTQSLAGHWDQVNAAMKLE